MSLVWLSLSVGYRTSFFPSSSVRVSARTAKLGQLKNFTSALSFVKTLIVMKITKSFQATFFRKLFQTSDVLFDEFRIAVKLKPKGDMCLINKLKQILTRLQKKAKSSVGGEKLSNNSTLRYLKQLNIEALILLRWMRATAEFR